MLALAHPTLVDPHPRNVIPPVCQASSSLPWGWEKWQASRALPLKQGGEGTQNVHSEHLVSSRRDCSQQLCAILGQEPFLCLLQNPQVLCTQTGSPGRAQNLENEGSWEAGHPAGWGRVGCLSHCWLGSSLQLSDPLGSPEPIHVGVDSRCPSGPGGLGRSLR